jgi:thiamine biosynthesis protein ThiI
MKEWHGYPEQVVMVRYGEIFLKSEPVKYHFIGILLRNIKNALSAAGLACRFETPRGRIIIHGTDPAAIARIVSRVFGVVDVSVCTLTGTDPASLCAGAVALASAHVTAPMRFAVRAKREKKTGMNSQEMGACIGSAICDRVPGLRVDLTAPEYEVFVEVREIGGLVCDARIPAPGGLPWGSQGKVLALLSSGIDSPVASWLAMKRGCEVSCLHMDGGQWAGGDVRAAAIENFRRLSLWCPGNRIRMIIADSELLYDRMQELRTPPRFRCVICKRFMIQVVSRFCAREKARAIVTGENLGQVASQTLANLAVISEAATVPVLRPLITYDKTETVALARKIGTFVAKPGDLACHVVPAMPATAADFDTVKRYEDLLDIRGLLDHALLSETEVIAENGTIEENI